MFVGIEDVLLASAEVGMNLTRKKCVLGDICSPRVLVERQQKEPQDTNKDAECRKVRRNLEQAWISSQC